tara:strand:+ start:3521 stop:3793 length:273 start_codon:yes stop_codon:yes gene_type:complete
MNTLTTNMKQKVEALVFEKEGRQFIALGNYALDFKKDYLYQGMTKSGQVKLGDITSYSFKGSQEEVQTRYGKIYDNKIHAEGSTFIERLN